MRPFRRDGMHACMHVGRQWESEATAETALTFKAERRRWLVLCSSESEEGTRARADREPRKREAWMDEWIDHETRGAEGRTQKMPEFFILGEKPREREKFGLAGRGQAKPFNLGWISDFIRSRTRPEGEAHPCQSKSFLAEFYRIIKQSTADKLNMYLLIHAWKCLSRFMVITNLCRMPLTCRTCVSILRETFRYRGRTCFVPLDMYDVT